MARVVKSVLLVSLVFGSEGTLEAQTAKTAPKPVFATVLTTMPTAGEHIRQFAFDGDASSYFASKSNAGIADHFSLLFDKPVAIKSIKVTTGRADGTDKLEEGALEGSADGKRFVPLAQFADGTAAVKPEGWHIMAVRIKPTAEMTHPLAIREFVVDSDPRVVPFKYPVEFVLDTTEAPEMEPWCEKVGRICERQYYMINEELRSDGFKPATVVNMKLSNTYSGVAGTSGARIQGSVKFFKSHPDDVGAMIHETVHVVQRYHGNYPGWLVEGIADYIRFVKFEPGKLRRLTPERAKYDGSYQTSAAFLDFVSKRYDKDLVRKLNAVLREGKYTDDWFKETTGKTLPELGNAWKASLRR